MRTNIDRLDWVGISAQLDIEGYAVLPGLLHADTARELARLTETISAAHRVPLASADLGHGELFYFNANLPTLLETWRTVFYRRLAVIANQWSEILGVGGRYPAEVVDFHRGNQNAGQGKKARSDSPKSVIAISEISTRQWLLCCGCLCLETCRRVWPG
jgi:hypothetical protein